MSSLSIFQIAGSAMIAQSQRMNVAASNIANADSVAGPDGSSYKARQVVFQSDPIGSQLHSHPIGGVKVSEVTESQAPARLVYDPKHPAADPSGYVHMSNVDVVAESVNMMSASRSYQANVEVINTAKSMMARALSLGK